MSSLHGSMVELGDELAATMMSMGVPYEEVGHWLREYVRSLDLARSRTERWDASGRRILASLTAAQVLSEAARTVSRGN